MRDRIIATGSLSLWNSHVLNNVSLFCLEIADELDAHLDIWHRADENIFDIINASTKLMCFRAV